MADGRRAFVSYSHLDVEVVERLERDLENLGWSAWCDRELSGGQRWWDGILDNIVQCEVFVFAMSAASLRSEACERELDYATRLQKPILPVLVGEPVPDALLPPLLSETQRVDGREGDARGALALGRALMQLPPAPPLPDPLPTAPAVPVSYLSDLKARVEQPRIAGDDQWRLLTEIEKHLAQPQERDAALALLKGFAERGDLMQSVAAAAQHVRDGYQDGADPGVPDPPDGPPDQSSNEPSRRSRRTTWIALAVGGALIAGAVVAVVLLTRGDDPVENTVDAFCDRARSADTLSDRFSALLVTPEADPVQLQQLFDDAIAELNSAALAAPPDIAAAAQVVADGSTEQGQILAQADWSLGQAAADFLQASSEAQFVAESAEFAEYLTDNCNVAWDEVGGFTDVSTAAEGLAVAFTAGASGVSATVDEAECMADALVGEIDGDRLLALYGQAVIVTRSESLLLVDAMQTCISVEQLVPGFAAANFANLPNTTAAQQLCLSRGVIDTISLKVWVETTVGSQEMIDQLTTIAEDCDVDPRLVIPLLGG